MASNPYSRGSEWRKWDLHIHAPFTKLNDRFKSPASEESSTVGDSDKKWEAYFKAIDDKNLEVLGVTDYFSLDGYEAVTQKARTFASKAQLFLPNIEFRIAQKNKDSEFIQIHVIFSNKIEVSRIKDFLTRLPLISTDDEKLINKYCTAHDLADIGYGKAMVNHKTLIDNLKKDFKERTEYFVFGVARGYGSIRPASDDDGRGGEYAKEIDKVCHGFFGADSDALFYLNRVGARAQYKLDPKPVFLCSDAHEMTDIGQKCTWVKADPTYDGLAQTMIAIEQRLEYGSEPKKIRKVRDNKTKYIRELKITKNDSTDVDDEWFGGVTLPFNNDLVAIIGNKGSGKSALTDILGVLGRAGNYDKYSFLRPEKFLVNRGKLAKAFEAVLTWESGDIVEDDLGASPAPDEPRRVKYIPQQYFENKCNEDDQAFETEIKAVIFSHIEITKRLNFGNLDDLLSYLVEPIDSKIEILRGDMKGINDIVLGLEARLDDVSISVVKKQLEAKEEELKSHEGIKPEAVSKPEEAGVVDPEAKKVAEELERSKKVLLAAEVKKNILEKNKASLSNKLAAADRLAGELNNIEATMIRIQANYKDDLNLLGLEFSDLAKVIVEKAPVAAIINETKANLSKIDKELLGDKETNSQGIYHQITAIVLVIEELEKQLDEPSQKYEQYIASLKSWSEKRAAIVGNEQTEGTIDCLKAHLQKIQSVFPRELAEAKAERRKKCSEIYKAMIEKVKAYESVFGKTQQLLSDYSRFFSVEQPKLMLSAEMKEARIGGELLTDWFFNYVSQREQGTFRGGGFGPFINHLKSFDFCVETQCLDFLDGVIDRLEHTYEEEKRIDGTKKSIRSQIKSSKEETISELYDGLYGLSFLKPSFSLKLGDKNLSQLSPGEKGAVLLIFYLLLDEEDVPLIIDQPEENLDNQSVYELLVPTITEAKKRRQVIIVTHNPNLAVVCNADQVIRASMDKINKNKVQYISGSIENPVINKPIIDILEGTLPAFDNRNSKYMRTSYPNTV